MIPTTDQIARGFLFVSNQEFIVPFLAIGFIWLHRRFFYEAMTLLLIGIGINVSLKITFHIPLSPSLGVDGFALPSGHMQLSCALYLWLLFRLLQQECISKTLKILASLFTVVVLTGISWGLIHFGYHTLIDVLTAVLVSILLIALYHLSLEKIPKTTPMLMLIIAAWTLGYNGILYPELPPNAWLAFYAVLGLILGETLFDSIHITMGFAKKALTTVLWMLIIGLVQALFQTETILSLSEKLTQFRWSLFTFAFPWSCFLANQIVDWCLRIDSKEDK